MGDDEYNAYNQYVDVEEHLFGLPGTLRHKIEESAYGRRRRVTKDDEYNAYNRHDARSKGDGE